MKKLLGIDIGTSGTKAVLYAENGTKIDEVTFDYPLYQEKSGYAEQNPKDWETATYKAISSLNSNNDITDLIGIGLSGQMHGLVMLDKYNQPLANSLIWCDTRADKECEEILSTMPNYSNYAINPPIVGFTLPKLLWIKNNRTEIYSKINKILLPKDYMNYCLTGEFITDVSDASGTGYFDINKREWSKEILVTFGIKEEWLPKVLESCEVAGNLRKDLIEEYSWSINNNVTIVAGAGDQSASALGNGIIDNNDSCITVGSSGVVFTATDTPIKDYFGRVQTFCHAVKNMWHIMGVTQGAGLSVKWFKDNFAKEVSYKDLDELSKEIPAGSNKLLFLPYLMGERTPHLDSSIRGAFIGISARHTLYDMYRAVLEGVAFSLKDCVELIKNLNIDVNSALIGGGGAKSNIWKQIIADALQIDLISNDNSESGTIGVAILASVGCGLYKDIKEAKEVFCSKNNSIINHTKDDTYEKYYALYKNLYELLKDNNKELFNL